MQRPGFNVQCNDNNHVRFGYCNNCASQGCQVGMWQDSDSTIGIGLTGQATPKEMGSGWTNYFASGAGTCNANSMTPKMTWVYVGSPQNAEPLRKARSEEEYVLAMKTTGDTVWGWSSSLWMNTETLEPNSPEEEEINAKYPAFNEIGFNTIRICVGEPTQTTPTGSPTGNCFDHTLAQSYSSLQALFSAGFIRDDSLDQGHILHTFGVAPGMVRSCGMQRPGFNTQCNDGNKARIGFCNNCHSQACQEADSHDADSAIGIGLTGQSTPRQMGAGWTNYFASGKGTCNANSMTAKMTWLYVKVK